MTNSERELIYKLADFVIREMHAEAGKLESPADDAEEMQALLDAVKAESHG